MIYTLLRLGVERDNLIEGLYLQIELFLKQVKLVCGLHDKFRVIHLEQLVVAVGTGITGIARRGKSRLGIKHHTVEVIVTLLDIALHKQCLIKTFRKDAVLRQQLRVLVLELTHYRFLENQRE